MKLRELIEVLTKFETVCGPEAETTALTVELCHKTTLSFKNERYSYRTEQVRTPTYWVSFDTQKLYDMSETRDDGLARLGVTQEPEHGKV